MQPVSVGGQEQCNNLYKFRKGMEMRHYLEKEVCSDFLIIFYLFMERIKYICTI